MCYLSKCFIVNTSINYSLYTLSNLIHIPGFSSRKLICICTTMKLIIDIQIHYLGHIIRVVYWLIAPIQKFHIWGRQSHGKIWSDNYESFSQKIKSRMLFKDCLKAHSFPEDLFAPSLWRTLKWLQGWLST